MVKLIRLNTANNDAHFKANFDNDIIINDNSKIALKNITFESDFGSYTSDSVSGILEFKGDKNIGSNFTFSTVEQKSYNRSNQTELENEVTNAYNRTLFLDKLRGKPEIYGEWKLLLSQDLKYVLEYRQSYAQSIFSGYYINLENLTDYPAEVWEQPPYPQNRFASNADFSSTSSLPESNAQSATKRVKLNQLDFRNVTHRSCLFGFVGLADDSSHARQNSRNHGRFHRNASNCRKCQQG